MLLFNFPVPFSGQSAIELSRELRLESLVNGCLSVSLESGLDVDCNRYATPNRDSAVVGTLGLFYCPKFPKKHNVKNKNHDQFKE